MRNLIFFVIFLMWVMSCNGISHTTIGVRVDGVQDNMKVSIETKDSTYTVALDSNGSGIIVLAENEKSGYATFAYGRYTAQLYIEPGKNFDISMKIDGRNREVTFAGEGAKKNEYLNNASFNANFSKSNRTFGVDEETFLTIIKEQEQKGNRYLDSMKFDEPFTRQERKRIRYMAYSWVPNYPSMHLSYSQDKAYKPSDSFYKQLKANIQEEEEFSNIPVYRFVLSGFISTYSTKDLNDADPLTLTKAKLSYVDRHIKSPVLACFLVDKFASDHVGKYGVDGLVEITPVYNAKVTCPDKKAKFDELCREASKISKGQSSPDFKCLDINGKEVRLADLAGKYVYIDIWATWCGPCKKEIPYLKKLEHKYKDRNICFVSISCDQDKAVWEKMVKEDKLEGIQLHFGEDRSFYKAYKINGIPRFILLDREGKIVEDNASRPSDPQTIKTLDALEGL